MRTAKPYAIVLVTTPNMTVARRIARALLAQRLVACANLIPGVESHYWWHGKCEKGREALMVLKTRKGLLAQLEQAVHSLHPYDTPEFLALNLEAGSQRYLDWLMAETHRPKNPNALFH
jgi:periplasmic divalent cation tolerance protein